MLGDLWTSLLAFTGTFIVPDWGALIVLIPVGLAAVVFMYVTWTVFRFAAAGPTSRGIRRLPPVAPAGVHMPGPSFAPVLAAFGAFMLLFGLFSGGVWTLVGVAVLVITLLYWGREALRDYDHVAGTHAGGAAGTLGTAGALPVPVHRTPPVGVHVPPPTFRPLLVSIAFTMLVAGLVIRGPAVLLGLLALGLALGGWLRDAGHEYTAVAAADETGHLDLGSAPAWPRATFAALTLLIAGALLLGSGLLGGAGNSAAPGAGGGASAAPSLSPADASLTAKDLAWSTTTLTVPAGRAFTLSLDNRDSVPHNVEIWDASGAIVFKGGIFSGPAVKVYDVPSLAVGQYTFVCSVHPNMTGTVTAQ